MQSRSLLESPTETPRKRFRAQQMQTRSAGLPIREPDRDQTSRSRLLSIPSELRDQIYEYVFGSGVLEVALRSCTYMDRCVFSYSPARQRLGGWIGPENESFIKFTYTICQDPQNWDDAYVRSRAAGGCEGLDAKHGYQCIDGILSKDFERASLVTLLLGDITQFDSEDDWRRFEADHASRLAGLKRQYAHSALDLSLLETCRQIYHEAWKLPFANYTFKLSDLALDHFGSKALFPHQANAVKSIHINENLDTENLCQMYREYPNVTELKCTIFADFVEADVPDLEYFFARNKLTSVQAMTGVKDRPGCLATTMNRRLEWLLTKLDNPSAHEIKKRIEAMSECNMFRIRT